MQLTVLDELAIGGVKLTGVFHQSTVFVEHVCHILLIYIAHINGGFVITQSGQNLFLLIDSHVGILSRLQRTADKGQQEGYEHHHHGCIADGIDIAVGVNALGLHLGEM